MTARKALPLLLLVGAVGVGTSSGQEKKIPAAEDTAAIRQLIEQLGSDSYRVREEATRKLRTIGEKALPEVEKALQSKNAEVRRRAERLAQQFRQQRKQRIFRELLAKAAALPIDQLIDQMAARREFDKPENWERFHQVAEALTMQASQLAGKEWKLPKLDHRKFTTVSEDPSGDSCDHKIRVDGISNWLASVNRCFVVSGGSINRIKNLNESIVFINGDLRGCTVISNSFVFCNGDIGRVRSVQGSVILATGDFLGSSSAESSFFQVKSVGRQMIARGNVYLNLDGISCRRSIDNKFPQSKKGPLQIVKFFDSAQLGIEFSRFGEQVRIDKVCEGTAFARAALRAGDVVLKAEKSEIASAEELRKFLRCRLPEEEFALTVRRGKTIVETKVKMTD